MGTLEKEKKDSTDITILLSIYATSVTGDFITQRVRIKRVKLSPTLKTKGFFRLTAVGPFISC